jgi:phage terminase small subunit
MHTPSLATRKTELTDKQEKFINALVSNGGKVSQAVEEAGYRPTSRSWLMRTLKDEILERTRSMLASYSVKAAHRITEGLDADGTLPVNQMDMRFKSAEAILDRVGLSKKHVTEIQGEVVHGIVMLPAKDKPKEVEVTIDG